MSPQQIIFLSHMCFKPHVFVGPLSQGAALIVKYCYTNFSANIIYIKVKFFYHTFMAMALLESGP